MVVRNAHSIVGNFKINNSLLSCTIYLFLFQENFCDLCTYPEFINKQRIIVGMETFTMFLQINNWNWSSGIDCFGHDEHYKVTTACWREKETLVGIQSTPNTPHRSYNPLTFSSDTHIRIQSHINTHTHTHTKHTLKAHTHTHTHTLKAHKAHTHTNTHTQNKHTHKAHTHIHTHVTFWHSLNIFQARFTIFLHFLFWSHFRSLDRFSERLHGK